MLLTISDLLLQFEPSGTKEEHRPLHICIEVLQAWDGGPDCDTSQGWKHFGCTEDSAQIMCISLATDFPMERKI